VFQLNKSSFGFANHHGTLKTCRHLGKADLDFTVVIVIFYHLNNNSVGRFTMVAEFEQ